MWGHGTKGWSCVWSISPEDISFPGDGEHRLLSHWEDMVTSDNFRVFDGKGEVKTRGLDKVSEESCHGYLTIKFVNFRSKGSRTGPA